MNRNSLSERAQIGALNLLVSVNKSLLTISITGSPARGDPQEREKERARLLKRSLKPFKLNKPL